MSMKEFYCDKCASTSPKSSECDKRNLPRGNTSIGDHMICNRIMTRSGKADALRLTDNKLILQSRLSRPEVSPLMMHQQLPRLTGVILPLPLHATPILRCLHLR